VKNQKAQRDSFPFNFTVCLSTMFDFTNVLQVTLRYIAFGVIYFIKTQIGTKRLVYADQDRQTLEIKNKIRQG